MPGQKRSSGSARPFSQLRRLAFEQPISRATCFCHSPRSRRTRRRFSPMVLGSSGYPGLLFRPLRETRRLMHEPLGVRAPFVTDPSRPDFPPRLPRKPRDGGRAPQACPARPGHPAEGGCPLHRLPPRHPRQRGRRAVSRPTFVSGRRSSLSWALRPPAGGQTPSAAVSGISRSRIGYT
jgi:hypothetical protein